MKPKHAIKQIETLGYREGDRVCLRAFLPEKGKDSGRSAEFSYPELPAALIDTWQQEGRGVYLVVNQGGHSDSEIQNCLGIFYEHDSVDQAGLIKLQEFFPDYEFEKKASAKSDRWLVPIEVQQQLWAVLGLPEPTMQISTGGKSLHSYWVFESPIKPDEWRLIQSDLLEFANADRALKNPSRVMRLAGCIHAQTGNYSLITGGCGKRYGFSELRKIIPPAIAQSNHVRKGVTWTEFNQAWRFPISDTVPLEVCLSRKNRELLDRGEQEGGRNDSGFKLASDLLATSAFLVQEGQRFSGDPYDLFIEFCQRCTPGDGWSAREWDLIWKSAQSKGRNCSLSPEQIEGCIKAWAWKNCPDRQKADVSSIGRSIPDSKTAVLLDTPDDATDEERLRLAIVNYNRVLDAGNPFQQVPLRRQIAKDWGLSVSEIDSLSRHVARGASGSMASLGEILRSVDQEIRDRAESGITPGIACGFYDLDAMTSGFQKSDLIIVAARPSIGKTSFVMNIARSVAVLQKIPIVVFSLEMSRESLAYRLLSSEAEVEAGRIRSGQLVQHEWEQLGHGIALLSQASIYIDDTPAISVAEIRSKCRRVQAETGQIGIVMIDYLQLISGASEDPVNSLDRITADLKTLGREIGAPIIALSQLSRGVESRDNKRPTMSDLRNSGGIEQNADLIAMLYRDEYYNPDTVDRGIAEVIITKHRNGPVGTVKLLFERHFTKFKNLAKKGGYEEPPVTRPAPQPTPQPVSASAFELDDEWEVIEE